MNKKGSYRHFQLNPNTVKNIPNYRHLDEFILHEQFY